MARKLRVHVIVDASRDLDRARYVVDAVTRGAELERSPFTLVVTQPTYAPPALHSADAAGLRASLARDLARAEVVILLVGRDTESGDWPRAALAHAIRRARPIVGMAIHQLPNEQAAVDARGKNPLATPLLELVLPLDPQRMYLAIEKAYLAR